jgi:phosphoribosylamine---glycine ligase
VQVLHAGTYRDESRKLSTFGGCVLSVAAYGNNLEEAVALAYKGVEGVQFKNMFYRKGIASRY